MTDEEIIMSHAKTLIANGHPPAEAREIVLRCRRGYHGPSYELYKAACLAEYLERARQLGMWTAQSELVSAR
jgi:hypothetical protein